MKTLSIGGHTVIFDDAMEREINQRTWSILKNRNVFYVRAGRVSLHRLVMKAAPRQIIDHINGNGLDNRRENLRIASHQMNRANSHCGVFTSSFIGVSKVSDRKRLKPYRVQAKRDGKNTHLGYFSTEVDAALAYDAHAKATYGELAELNFKTTFSPNPERTYVI